MSNRPRVFRTPVRQRRRMLLVSCRSLSATCGASARPQVSTIRVSERPFLGFQTRGASCKWVMTLPSGLSPHLSQSTYPQEGSGAAIAASCGRPFRLFFSLLDDVWLPPLC